MTTEELTATVRANMLELAEEHDQHIAADQARYIWPLETAPTGRQRYDRIISAGWVARPVHVPDIANAFCLTPQQLFWRLLAPRGAL